MHKHSGIYLDADLKSRLETKAEEEKLSYSSIIRVALHYLLNHWDEVISDYQTEPSRPILKRRTHNG